MNTRSARVVFWIAACALGVAIGSMGVLGQRELKPGDPLPGITPVEFSEFRLGLEDFTEVETAEDGLGPAFNGTSCAVCHSVPAIGGSGVMLETRVAYREESGAFRGLNDAGDTLMHLFSVPSPVRRRAGRGDSRRPAAGPRGSARSQSRWHQRPRGHRRRRRDA